MKFKPTLIFILTLLHSFTFCFGQNIEMELPKSSYDSLQYSIVKVKFDMDKNTFFISNQSHDKTLGFIALSEYTGNLADLDSIYVSADKQKKGCVIEFHSCKKAFQKTMIPISTYILDEPKIEMKNLRLTSRGISHDDGLDYVFLNGHCAKSRHAEEAIRTHLKSCFTADELNGIDLIKLKIDINKQNKLVVEHLFYEGAKKKPSKQTTERVKNCLQNLEGWTKKERAYGKFEVPYILSMHSPNIDEVAEAKFEEIKVMSVERQIELDKKRGVYNKKYTKAQQDSIFNESIFEAMSADNSQSDEPYRVVEQRPALKDENWLKQINEEIKKLYPDKKYLIGVQFIVDKEGAIKDIDCVRGLRQDNLSICDSIKEKMMRTKQPYKPGKQRGKIVSVYVYERFISQ